MNGELRIGFIFFAAAVWSLFASPSLSQAQQNTSQEQEVYLTFQYRGVVSKYVTTYYKNQQFYLPVSELFNTLKINHNVAHGTLTISGRYLEETDYVINFQEQIARAGDIEIQLQTEDFLIKEMDYFVKPSVFNKLFDLEFTTNFNNLTLDLSTKNKMPVVAQYEREQKRKQLNRKKPIYDRTHYPLEYDRNYSSIDGAFLDYNMSATFTNTSQLFTFSNSLGMELFAGDVQGSVFGAFSDQQNSLVTNGLRWRYVQRNNELFSTAIAGQTFSEGLTSRSITGVKISNKPIEARQLFDRYPIEGNVPAQSEVELYLNNRLVDYQEADQSGNYRFLVPLTYGSTDYTIRVYTPDGRQIERNERIQVPFDYVPPGEVDYNISGGQLQNPILGATQRGYMGQAGISVGLNNWLTAKASTEYLTDYHSLFPSFTGTLNARLFNNYLISANINSENFYRLTSSVVYSSGASWSLSYEYNPGNSRLYNVGGSDHDTRVDLFIPFQLGTVPLNIRWSTAYQQRGTSKQVRYRANLNTRLDRLNVRFGYQDQQVGEFRFNTTSSSRITNSYTYSIGRFRNVPGLLRGMFLRGQISYLPGLEQFEEMEINLSRELFQSGRIQLEYGHNFIGNFNSLSLNITVDFNKLRTNTTARTTGTDMSFTQNVRGSIGYDPYGDQLILNNRQQVGQAGAAVRLFVDKNNDGNYQKDTDKVITDPAVRLNRAGGRTTVKNGVNYISQLLTYYRYDLEINKGALSNPLLVPDIENFSIITDPNQFKPIEIPFYQSGVISGKVERMRAGEPHGLGGVRLYLQSDYENSDQRDSFRKEMRTFSDGSFYTYEIPPGEYNLFIDPNQLDLLQTVSKPDTMNITLESMAQGDFVENLNFTIIPKTESADTSSKPVVSEKSDSTESMTDQQLYYRIQLASFKNLEKAKNVAQKATLQLGDTFSVIKNTSNGWYAIRSTPITEYDKTVETIISYRKSSYKKAAAVVLKDEEVNKTADQSPFIQIGSFSTKQRAQQFADAAAQELQKGIAIKHQQDNQLYDVYIYELFHSHDQQNIYLNSLKNRFSFEEAYINQSGKVQIGAFSTKEKAKNFGHLVGLKFGSDVSVTSQTENGMFDVFVDRNFQSVNKKTAYLKYLKNMGSVFNDAFVARFSDPTLDVTANQRKMKFSFEIRVKSGTEEIIQQHLTSVSGKTVDIEILQNDKGELVINNIPSWTITRNIYRRLENELKLDYSILVLIEEKVK